MTEQANVLTGVNANEYRSLIDQINELKNSNNNLIIDKERLNLQLREAKKEKESDKVLVKIIRENNWGEEKITTDYKNLADIKEELKEQLDLELKTEINNLKKINKNLQNNNEDLQHNINLQNERHYRDKQSYESSLKTKYQQKIETQNNEIEKLEEELVKVKEGKTDEQIKENQALHTASLESLNLKLRNKIDEYKNMSWWKRLITPIESIKGIIKEVEEDIRNLFISKNNIINLLENNRPPRVKRGSSWTGAYEWEYTNKY